MKLVKLKTVEGKVRYYLADDTGAPVSPVLKYLKFKDNVGYDGNCGDRNYANTGIDY